MNTKLTIYLDAGHGTIDSNGKYTTPAVNGKWYHHKSLNYTFYEGFWNRIYANEFYMRFKDIFDIIMVSTPIQDNPLKKRVDIANTHYKQNKLSSKEAIYLSFHSNAANTKARGWSIFCHSNSSKGKLASSLIFSQIDSNKTLLGIDTRRPLPSQDFYTANFYVLQATAMPAVLIENLFFDNLEDSLLIMNPLYIGRYLDLLSKGLMEYHNSQTN